MKQVEFYKLNNDGSQTTIAVFQMNNSGLITSLDNSGMLESFTAEGIRDYSDESRQTVLFPKDGLKFLEQLKYNFKSGYLNASDILEK